MEKKIKIVGDANYQLVSNQTNQKTNNLIFELETPQSNLNLSGIFKIIGERSHYLKIKVIHKSPKSKAEINILSILNKKTEFILEVQTIIESQATQSSEKLFHHSLLIDGHSKSFTIPSQEILASNCSCTHDLIIENIDQNQFQYLISKGISPKKAENMYISALRSNIFSKKNSQTKDILISF